MCWTGLGLKEVNGNAFEGQGQCEEHTHPGLMRGLALFCGPLSSPGQHPLGQAVIGITTLGSLVPSISCRALSKLARPLFSLVFSLAA